MQVRCGKEACRELLICEEARLTRHRSLAATDNGKEISR
jgi:hypothetical protein